MPFKSKAQQRFLYSQNPKVAKKFSKETKKAGVDMAHLPEKLHPRTKAKAKRLIAESMGIKSSKAK